MSTFHSFIGLKWQHSCCIYAQNTYNPLSWFHCWCATRLDRCLRTLPPLTLYPLYHNLGFIITASINRLSEASLGILALSCIAWPQKFSETQDKESTSNLLLYLSCFQREYHIDDTVKTSYQFGCILNILNSNITVFLGTQISYAFSAL